MRIFLDESGLFLDQGGISAVGALIIPDHHYAGFLKLFGRLRRRLPQEKGEVKGRLLAEVQVAEVALLLRKLNCVFGVVVVDAAAQTADDIRYHQQRQAEKITENLTPDHQPGLISDVWKLRTQLERTPPQLYVQSCAMSELLYHTLSEASAYFSFRLPRELGKYKWTIDAKGSQAVTPWEDWWSKVIFPMIESKTFDEPFMMLEGGDYRWQERFATEPSEYKKQFLNAPLAEVLDLKPMLSDMEFSSSPEMGLEAVDILVNAIRRALGEKLRAEGYLPIRELMIHRSKHYIRFISLAAEDRPLPDVNYRKVVKDFTEGGRTMWPGSQRRLRRRTVSR